MEEKDTQPASPWWTYGHLWLVLAGPFLVVIASFVTAYLAVHGQDPVLDENYYQKGLRINEELADKRSSYAPALKGRNHAATGAPIEKTQP